MNKSPDTPMSINITRHLFMAFIGQFVIYIRGVGVERKVGEGASFRNGTKSMEGQNFKSKAKLKRKKKYFFASMIKIQLSVNFFPSGSFDPVYPGFPVQMYL